MKFYVTSKISENMHETPEGYLLCLGVPIARTGEMTYGRGESPLEPGDDGKVIVTRDKDAIFSPETMASFEGKAVTIGHPDDFVSPENWSQLTKGVIQNVRRGTGANENDLIADLLITDSKAIELVKAGLREVSCGYEADFIQAGIGRGVQESIIGNHLALVDQGRAGSSYAINDSKTGKGSRMKLKDKIQAIFAKAQDEAMKVAEDSANTETPVEKKGFVSMDDMKSYLDGKFEAMMGGKKKEGEDASTQPTESAPAKVVAKDDEVAPGLEDRLAKLEAAVAKLLESQVAPKVGDEDGDEDEVSDEDCEDEDGDDDMVGDEDSDKKALVGDAASRVEILAPGMKASGKDVKARAIKTAYATKDGKAVIDQLTGGKAPELKDEKQVNTLFIAASELLKANRNTEFSKTKTRDSDSTVSASRGVVTAEKMNEINQKHWATRSSH